MTHRAVTDVVHPAVEDRLALGDDCDVPPVVRLEVRPSGRSCREGPAVQDHSVHAVHVGLPLLLPRLLPLLIVQSADLRPARDESEDVQ